MSNPTTRGRARRFTGLAAAFVALLAGVAVAYFLTQNDFGGNEITGGTLTVDSSLEEAPLDFTNQTVYPTNEGAADGAEDTFTITNNNPVDVRYTLAARCGEKPTGKSAADDVDFLPCLAGSDELAQFNELMVRIQGASVPGDNGDNPLTTTECDDVEDALNNCTDPVAGTVYYEGPLSGLGTTAMQSQIVLEGGDSAEFDVTLWLRNTNEVQPQAITTPFVVRIGATTPTEPAPAP